MPSHPDYSKRPAFFSHRFTRLLAKACAANDIGAEACWLLVTVAHTEDAKGSLGTVPFLKDALTAHQQLRSESLKRRRIN